MTPEDLVKYTKRKLVEAGYGDCNVRASYGIDFDGIEVNISSKNNIRYMAHRLPSPVTVKSLKHPVTQYMEEHVIGNIEEDIKAGHTDWVTSKESQK